MNQAGLTFADLDAIAVTEGPGLVGLINWRRAEKRGHLPMIFRLSLSIILLDIFMRID